MILFHLTTEHRSLMLCVSTYIMYGDFHITDLHLQHKSGAGLCHRFGYPE